MLPETVSRSPRISGMTVRSIRGSSTGVASGAVAQGPDTIYAGVEGCRHLPLNRRRENWKELPAFAAMAPAPNGSRARAACACIRSFSIQQSAAEWIAISAAGAFRTDDGGKAGSRSTAG